MADVELSSSAGTIGDNAGPETDEGSGIISVEGAGSPTAVSTGWPGAAANSEELAGSSTLALGADCTGLAGLTG